MKNNKGFTPIAIVFIIITVLAVGGVVYYAGKSSTPAPQNTVDDNYQPPVDQGNVTNTPPASNPKPTPVDETANWKTYEDTNRGFSFKYPSSWTYQKFQCNVDGVAFCSLAGNSASNCRQTCSSDSPESPIYLHFFQGTPAVDVGEYMKYWPIPNVSLLLSENYLNNTSYKEVYKNVVSTLKFTVTPIPLSRCMPSDTKLSDIVSADGYPGQIKKVTVEQKLNELKAICNSNNKLVDSAGKQITFYRLDGCWGNPPYNYQDILQKQREDINKLKEQYTVVEMTCNPSGIPIP